MPSKAKEVLCIHWRLVKIDFRVLKASRIQTRASRPAPPVPAFRVEFTTKTKRPEDTTKYARVFMSDLMGDGVAVDRAMPEQPCGDKDC